MTSYRVFSCSLLHIIGMGEDIQEKIVLYFCIAVLISVLFEPLVY